MINILRFLGIVDADGKRTEQALALFSKHADEDFQAGLSELIKEKYSQLFDLHQDNSWSLPVDKLISFFRNSDQTSLIVGQRQAGVFQALASLAGHSQSVPKTAPRAAKRSEGVTQPKTAAKHVASPPAPISPEVKPPEKGLIELSMRVEINLPIAPDQETYDRIFRSIKENLLNG